MPGVHGQHNDPPRGEVARNGMCLFVHDTEIVSDYAHDVEMCYSRKIP